MTRAPAAARLAQNTCQRRARARPHPRRQTRAGCPARTRPAPRTARGCPWRRPPGRARPTARLRGAARAPRLSATAPPRGPAAGLCAPGRAVPARGQDARKKGPGRTQPAAGPQRRPAGRTGEAAHTLAGRSAPATATRPPSRAPCGEGGAGPGRGALTTRLTSGDFSMAAVRPRPPMFSWLRKLYSSCATSAVPPCASASAPPAPPACRTSRQRRAARHARAEPRAPWELLCGPLIGASALLCYMHTFGAASALQG